MSKSTQVPTEFEALNVLVMLCCRIIAPRGQYITYTSGIGPKPKHQVQQSGSLQICQHMYRLKPNHMTGDNSSIQLPIHTWIITKPNQPITCTGNATQWAVLASQVS